MLKKLSFIILISTVIGSCSIDYKLNGASIDYSKTKTITIKDFNYLAPLVNPSFAPTFNESIRDIYNRQTRLKAVTNNGDIQVEGEITGYDLTPMAIQANALAAETRLTVTIKVRYSNKANPQKNFEKEYTAFQNFSSSKTINEVENDLCKMIIDELCETIYNQTVADW
jgi:hypothetical protein